MIWTTTPWTIPANQALNVHPELDYALVDTDARPAACSAASLVETLPDSATASTGTVRRHRARARRSSGLDFRHPLATSMRLRPPVAGLPGDYVTLDDGTGIVHSSPAYGVEDFDSCRAHGMKDDEILNPVQGDGVYAPRCRCSAAMNIWKANPKIVEALRDAGRLLASGRRITHSYMHCWRHKTPVIYRADDAVVRRHGRGAPAYSTATRRRETLRADGAARRSRRRSSIPRGARRGCTA